MFQTKRYRANVDSDASRIAQEQDEYSDETDRKITSVGA
jgi:hypothetical protein